MSEQQLTPEQVGENELICERLLGWSRIPPPEGVICWDKGDTHTSRTPSFTTWAEAGMILDALVRAGQRPDVSYYDRWYSFVDANCREGDEFPDAHDSGPLAIRAAALAYIRSLP